MTTYSSVKKNGIFISYSRGDGSDFAAGLRTALMGLGINVLQDHHLLEGGREWWEQLKQAIAGAEHLVLIMTPRAIASQYVRREWIHARQMGTCVRPVIAVPKTEMDKLTADLPRWMREAHWYDIGLDPVAFQSGAQWSRLFNDLNSECHELKVPLMMPDLPAEYVRRSAELEWLLNTLTDKTRGNEEPVAITTALPGAGGFGKTTLAAAICHDERVQRAFDDGILWVILGESVTQADLLARVESLIFALSGARSDAPTLEAAISRLKELLQGRDILLVIDDVWDVAHLRPFIQGGERCARLITTRNRTVLPANTQTRDVDAMRATEAVELLSLNLDKANTVQTELTALAGKLGEWALLLKLVNGVLRERVRLGESIRIAIAWANKALERKGFEAFTAQTASGRESAASATLGISLSLLSIDERSLYEKLAIFPEDVDVPLPTLEKLWGVDDFDTEELCHRLYTLSLLLNLDLTRRVVRLHDVVRTYLRTQQKADLPRLNSIFLDAYSVNAWAELPEREPYLWDRLAYHLLEAGRGNELVHTITDLRYLAAKTAYRNTIAAEADWAIGQSLGRDDHTLSLLARRYQQKTHTLNNHPKQEVLDRLCGLLLLNDSDSAEFMQQNRHHLPRPYFQLWHERPDIQPALIRLFKGHTNSVLGCAYSPDGTTIVSASEDNTLRVWDAHTGQSKLTLEGHTNSVLGCAYSPDGTTIVSASEDNTLRVWDAHTGQSKLILEGHTGRVLGCAYSPDGTTIVSASEDNALRVWDAHTGQSKLTLEGHTNSVLGCAYSPDGTTIVSASEDNTLRVWDAHTGQSKLILEGHTGRVLGCAYSPDGTTIVSASFDHTLRVWDAHTGQSKLTLEGHTGRVLGCAYSPDGTTIVSASFDHTLRVWDAHTGQSKLTLEGHISSVKGCAYSPDGKFILSASYDHTLRLWDAHIGQYTPTLKGHGGWLLGCAYSPDGTALVSASHDRTLRVWDTYTGQPKFTLEGHMDGVWACAYSPDGTTIVSASFDHTLRLWDARTGQSKLILEGHTGGVVGCAFSPDSASIVSASFDNTLRVWDAHSGQTQLTLQGHRSRVRTCAYSPDGACIVSASFDKTLRIWDAHTGQSKLTLEGHTDKVLGCAYSPDGTSILSTSEDKTARMWDAHSGQPKFTLEGHTSIVFDCSFSPDGKFILTASSDSTLRAWNAQTGSPCAVFYADVELSRCAFAPDDEGVVAGGENGYLYWLRLVR